MGTEIKSFINIRTMVVNRFYNKFYVNVEEDQDPSDRFWKIRPLYNTICDILLSLPLETHLLVNEQMVSFTEH